MPCRVLLVLVAGDRQAVRRGDYQGLKVLGTLGRLPFFWRGEGGAGFEASEERILPALLEKAGVGLWTGRPVP